MIRSINRGPRRCGSNGDIDRHIVELKLTARVQRTGVGHRIAMCSRQDLTLRWRLAGTTINLLSAQEARLYQCDIHTRKLDFDHRPQDQPWRLWFLSSQRNVSINRYLCFRHQCYLSRTITSCRGVTAWALTGRSRPAST